MKGRERESGGGGGGGGSEREREKRGVGQEQRLTDIQSDRHTGKQRPRDRDSEGECHH